MERNWLGGREEGMKERTRWDEEGRKGKVKEKRGPVLNASYLLAYMLPDQTERTNHKCCYPLIHFHSCPPPHPLSRSDTILTFHEKPSFSDSARILFKKGSLYIIFSSHTTHTHTHTHHIFGKIHPSVFPFLKLSPLAAFGIL